VSQVTYSRTLRDLGDTDGALEGLGIAQLMVNRSSIFISQSRLDVEIDWILPGFGTVTLNT
jgi:hypothetical protein